MTVGVVFLQGAGAGAHEEDAPLAASLATHLGDGFSVDFPTMPENDADGARWHAMVAQAIGRAAAPVVLVGHSAGGYQLLTYLARDRILPPIAAICLIAAPFPGADPGWTFEGFDLPDNLADRMPMDAAVLLYASEDDEVVPFAHRDLYAAALPGAVVRTTTGGHQLGGDLRVVAEDIRRVLAERR